MKRLLTGVLSLAAIFTTLPISQIQAAENQYWTDAQEKAGYVEKVMNDGKIGSTFHEGIMTVEGEPPTALTSTQISSLAINHVLTQALV